MARRERIPDPKSRTRVTVRDIARIAGVSASTVSRVLNNGAHGELISEETRRKVREVAADLGYSPNPLAKALRGGQTNLIGLIVREIADPFFAQIIQELSNLARGNGYQIVLGYAHNDPDEALKISSILDIRHTDGVIVMGDLHDNDQVLMAMLENNPAVVVLGRGTTPMGLPTINIDNAAGMLALFDHLYDLGHRRIGFLDGSWLGDFRERRETFIQCMRLKQLVVLPDWIQKAANGPGGGYHAMQALLHLSPADRPTAVIAADDTMAMGAIKAALDSGLRVPEDVSVTGFDDIEFASYMSPSLTTVRQPIEKMANHTIDAVLALIKGNPPRELVVCVQPELIIRASTAQTPQT